MKDNTYITIQSWMRTELNLSGNELLVYAVIYGFSQDGESRFKGSRQYIADWCGCTTRNVQLILNSFVERGIITKYESTINNIKVCEYVANFTGSEKISLPSEKISLYNIDNTIESNISIINNTNNTGEVQSHCYSVKELKEDFLGSVKHTKNKVKKKNLYEQCQDEVYLAIRSLKLQDALLKYIPVRLANKEKQLYGINQWKLMLSKLLEMSTDESKLIAIVNQSIERGWCSFFPIQESKQFYGGEHGNVLSKKLKDTDEEILDEKY